MDLVTVYTAQDELMANSVRDLLLQHNIPAMIRPFGASGYGGFSVLGVADMSSFGNWGEVLVYDHDAEAALEQIGGFLGELGMLEEFEMPGEAEEESP